MASILHPECCCEAYPDRGIVQVYQGPSWCAWITVTLPPPAFCKGRGPRLPPKIPHSGGSLTA